MIKTKHETLTRGIVNCRCSAFSSGTARIKSSCNLDRKVLRNRQLTIPPTVSTHPKRRHERQLTSRKMKEKMPTLRKIKRADNATLTMAVWLVAVFEALSYQVTTTFDTSCAARIPTAPAINYTAC